MFSINYEIDITTQSNGERGRVKGMKFLADRMLGKLAKELRMLGYDTLYYRGENTYPLIKWAREEDRMILTRNTKLLPRRPEDRILRIMEDNPLLQLKELIKKGLVSLKEENFFVRCLLCNHLLDEMPREEAEGNVPDFIFHQQKEYSRCPQCLKIYWKGSHRDHMKRKVEKLFG